MYNLSVGLAQARPNKLWVQKGDGNGVTVRSFQKDGPAMEHQWGNL